MSVSHSALPRPLSRPLSRGLMLAGLLALLLALSACGSQKSELGTLATGALKGLIPGQAAAPAAPDPRQVLTREMLDATPVPVLLVDNETSGRSGTLIAVADNGPWRSWRDAEGLGLNFRAGLLGRSQGLGEDLVSADLDEPLGALAALLGGRAGRVEGAVRVHRYLDGERQEVTRSFVCAYGVAGAETLSLFARSYATRHLVETCRGPDLEFRNDYWIGGDGTVRKSRQWVGPEAGYLRIEQLRP